MPTVSWKLPPPNHPTTSAVPPLTRDSSTPTVRSSFYVDDVNPFDDDNSFDDDNDPAVHWKAPPSSTLGDSSTEKNPATRDWRPRSSFDDDSKEATPATRDWRPRSSFDDETTPATRDWRPRSSFDDETTPATRDWSPRSSFDDNSKEATPATRDWSPRSSLDDDSKEATPATRDWKHRSSFDDDSKEATPATRDWRPRSSFDDNLKEATPADNWKHPPLIEDDNSKEPTPADNWKHLSLIEEDKSSRTSADNWKHLSLIEEDKSSRTSAENWKHPPLVEDDNSPRTTSADDPEVPPAVHDDNSMKEIPTYTPYLQLPHLLSLSWLTYPIISLILVAFRLQASLASAESALDNVKNDLLASCTAAERAATATASMPRYLAQISNQQFADAANGVMTAAQSALILSLTILEATLNFIIDMYRSTFLCLLELSMGIGLSLVNDAVQALSTSVASIGNNLASEIANANNALTNAVNQINKADPFSKISAPTPISTSDLSSLQNLTLPSSFQSTLSSVNSSMPTANQIKAVIDDLIDTPFELLKKAINNTFNNLTFDVTLFPVPAQNRLSFCNDLDTSSIDALRNNLINVAKYGTIAIIGLAGVLIGLNCLLIWYRWRSMKAHLERTRQAWMSDPINNSSESSPSAPQITLSDHNLMMLHADSEHPLITRIMNFLAARTNMTPSQHIDMRWFFHYVFHPPALACFLIGFFGLLSIMIQLLLLGPLVAAARAGVNIAVSDLSRTIVHTVNTTMYNQSATYANDINSKVDVVQKSINDGLFGWVNGTTTMLNTTINNFYTEVQNFVSHIFNGTVLETPASAFLQCVIGTKVANIEEALTFLNTHLVVDIPRVNHDVLVLSPNSINEATAPIASGAAGSESSGDQGILGNAVALYEDSLKAEAVIFGCFIGLWGIVVAIAICILLWRTHKRKREAKRQRAILEVQEKLKEPEHVEVNNISSPNFNDEKNKDLFMD